MITDHAGQIVALAARLSSCPAFNMIRDHLLGNSGLLCKKFSRIYFFRNTIAARVCA
jgi:hypothetical protein